MLPLKIRIILSIGIGIGLIILAFVYTNQTFEFVKKAATTDGVVIATPSGGSHPNIEYTNSSGEKAWYTAGGMIFGYKVGDRVQVLYDPANPAHTNIDDFGALYGFWICDGIIGIFLLITPILYRYGLSE